MAKILHTADLHLGSTFYALDEERAKCRRKELMSVFDCIVDTVKEEKVEYLLISGDLFDNAECVKEAEYVNARFGDIRETEILIAAGNHDPKTRIYDKIEWSGNVHIFGGELECVEYSDCVVWGASFLKEYQRAPLLHETEKSEKANILVMHGDFSDSAYNLIDKELLKQFDYAALGHIHRYDGIKNTGIGCYAYSGTPAGHGFDEAGENGFIIGNVENGSVNLNRRITSAREYYTLKYDVGECESNSQIAQIIRADMQKNNLYRICLSGECDFDVSEEYLEKTLENACFFVKVEDCTGEYTDYVSLANEYSVVGIFVSEMLDKIENESDIKLKAEYERALKIGVRAFDGRSDLFD